MPAGRPRGQPKSGGREKGTPNRSKCAAQLKAEELGVDPFETLLLFAKGDWKALGYENEMRTVFTPQGIEMEEPVIKPELRHSAAKAACEYILPKKKAVEHSLANDSEISGIKIEIVKHGNKS